MFTRATRKKAKLRMGIAAPSGAGKTYGALQLAKGLGDKIAFIDSEQGSASLYSHLGEFDVCELTAPFTTKKYLDAINAAEKAGYDVIIVDSLSHAWAGEGGLLEQQADKAKVTKNSYTAWRDITPMHNELVNAILGSPCHIICTMRSKQAHEIVEENGKKKVEKLGLAPVQREGMEYEFTAFLDIDQGSHLAHASKDRTGLFGDRAFKLTPQDGKMLLDWLDTGESPEVALEKKEAREKAEQAQAEAEATDLIKVDLASANTEAELRTLMNAWMKRSPAVTPKLIHLWTARKTELKTEEATT